MSTTRVQVVETLLTGQHTVLGFPSLLPSPAESPHLPYLSNLRDAMNKKTSTWAFLVAFTWKSELYSEAVADENAILFRFKFQQIITETKKWRLATTGLLENWTRIRLQTKVPSNCPAFMRSLPTL